MKNLKIDKSFCKAQSFEAAVRSNVFDKTIPIEDRLRLAFHLSCTIHGIKEGDSLRLDRTVFSAYKFKDA